MGVSVVKGRSEIKNASLEIGSPSKTLMDYHKRLKAFKGGSRSEETTDKSPIPSDALQGRELSIVTREY